MSSQNDTTETIEIDSLSIPKRVGRPKIYENGAKEHEKETKYHQQYYHLTNKPINCELCGKQVSTRTLTQHKKSMKCRYTCLTVPKS